MIPGLFLLIFENASHAGAITRLACDATANTGERLTVTRGRLFERRSRQHALDHRPEIFERQRVVIGIE